MPKIVFLSHHVYESPRRAGFHALAQSFASRGWKVNFITTGISLFSILRRDRRISSLTCANVLGSFHNADGIFSHVHFTTVHPVRIPTAFGAQFERLAAKIYSLGLGRYVKQILDGADIVVFESNSSLLLAKEVRRAVPKAQLVYRVSDDVRVVGMAAAIVEAEGPAVELMDIVSVPSRHLLATRFAHVPHARFHPHGVPQALFASLPADPYPNHHRPILACVGSTLFDVSFVAKAAQSHSTCDFHYVGNIPALQSINLTNVHTHGELPFVKALAFSAFADVGIANYKIPENGEYLAETSNKMMQYAFLGKPIVAPIKISNYVNYENVFYYEPDNELSIAKAIDDALNSQTRPVDRSKFLTWEQVGDMILSDIAYQSANSQSRRLKG